jgi:hypothetical protein
MKKFHLSSSIAYSLFFVLLLGLFSGCDELPDDLFCADKLSGKWVRVESNNSSNDCMQVVISGEEAILLDNPRAALGGLEVGATLWQNISAENQTEAGVFDLEVLGSDGNYYSATLTEVDDNTLELQIANTGSGNAQKWVRVETAGNLSECNTADLDGSWVRVNSNNANNDGMIIRITGSEAELTFVPSTVSSYTEGDILWRAITSTGSDNFTLEVMGSDGNYYSSSLELQGSDRLTLSIGSSGSGNQQTWERQ